MWQRLAEETESELGRDQAGPKCSSVGEMLRKCWEVFNEELGDTQGH